MTRVVEWKKAMWEIICLFTPTIQTYVSFRYISWGRRPGVGEVKERRVGPTKMPPKPKPDYTSVDTLQISVQLPIGVIVYRSHFHWIHSDLQISENKFFPWMLSLNPGIGKWRDEFNQHYILLSSHPQIYCTHFLLLRNWQKVSH